MTRNQRAVRQCMKLRTAHCALRTAEWALCLVVVAGCGGGPPMDRKDTVKSVKITLHFGRGVVETLELPDEFRPLEEAGKDVEYTIAERGVCKRVLEFLSSVKPGGAAAKPDRPAIGHVVVRTGWGRVVQLTWFDSRFEVDHRHLESSQLSKVLAAAVREAGGRGGIGRRGRAGEQGSS